MASVICLKFQWTFRPLCNTCIHLTTFVECTHVKKSVSALERQVSRGDTLIISV